MSSGGCSDAAQNWIVRKIRQAVIGYTSFRHSTACFIAAFAGNGDSGARQAGESRDLLSGTAGEKRKNIQAA